MEERSDDEPMPPAWRFSALTLMLIVDFAIGYEMRMKGKRKT
jgi:hypothetical protein